MPESSSPASSSLTDEDRTKIRTICADQGIDLDDVELQSGVLILSPTTEGEHPDAVTARTLSRELKQLGFDFVTITAPSADGERPNSDKPVGDEPTAPFDT